MGKAEEKQGIDINIMFDLLPDPICLIQKGCFVFLNSAWEKILGYSKEEMMGKEVLSFIHSDDLEPTLNVNIKYEQKETSYFRNRFIAKDGSIRHFEWNYIRNNENEYYATARDITDQVSQSNSLLESESLFRITFDTSPDVIVISELSTTKIINVNPGFERITGYTKSEVINKTAIDINLWKNEKEREILVRELQNHGFAENLIAEFHSKDCKVIVGLVSATLINLNGKPHILTIVKDITQIKLSEIELIQSEGMFRTLSEQSFLGITIIQDNRIAYTNKATADINEISIEEMYAWKKIPYKETIHPDDLEFAVDQAQKKQRGEIDVVESYDYRIITGTGKIKWVSQFSKTITYNGKPADFITLQDITNKKEKEVELDLIRQKLEENNQRLKIFQENAFEGIVISEEGVIIDANNTILQIMGVNYKEAIGKKIIDFIPLENRNDVIEKIQNNFEGTYESKIIKRNGRVVPIETRARTLIINNMKNRITSIRDISERKINEATMLLAIQKAEENNKLKTAFLQNMSHEIRTPLNGIIGFAQLLKYPNIDIDEIQGYSNLILNSGNRLLTLINNILDISKIESGSKVVNITNFNLNLVLSDLKKFYSKIIHKNNLELIVHQSNDNSLINIQSDKSLLYQILHNLIDNAIKFTEKGSITVSCKIEDEFLLFEITDTGIGIDPNNIHKIFDRFYQIDLSLTRGHEGAGLGLSIVKGLVEVLGGKIWVESELEKGTSFYFNLPFSKIDNTEELNPNDIYSNSALIKKENKIMKILIVDDDESSSNILSVFFKRNNYEIITSKNGLDAIEQYKANPDISLILMDIKMPIMNGLEATKQIKAINPKIPIIIQSANAYEVNINEGYEAGCDDYITKPIDIEELSNMIKKYL